jgi:hypothetical protein
MHSRKSVPFRAAAFALFAGVLGACDVPTDAGDRASALPGAPSMLLTPACDGTGGQTHPAEWITTAQTWSRAASPHRVMGDLVVYGAGRITVAPGAVVCFEPGADITTENGGRISARGRDTAVIVLTARDPAKGWGGLKLWGSPAGASYLTNVRIEHVNVDAVAVYSANSHIVYVDSAVIRQSGQAALLAAPSSRIARSRVDTTTNRTVPAVDQWNGARFENTVVRRAAGIGVRVFEPNVTLAGGRIEDAGGVGLQALGSAMPLSAYSKAVRVVGGRSYGAEISASALARLYPTVALQDSLRGNALDTVVVRGGEVRNALTVSPRLPLRLTEGFTVGAGGVLTVAPGTRLSFGAHVGMGFRNGGRLWSRGTPASPVVLTADDPAYGWGGISFMGDGTSTNYVTNTRIEHVGLEGTGVLALGSHRVIVDSSVIRMSGRAASLHSTNSRLSRTRVDTTLNADFPAVDLGANARLESTRILAAAGHGLNITSGTVVVASCDIRDGERDAILMDYAAAPVHNCNFVNNRGMGIRNNSFTRVSVTGNWWNSTGGPFGAGGANMFGPLDHSPWRTTPYVLPYLPSF